MIQTEIADYAAGRTAPIATNLVERRTARLGAIGAAAISGVIAIGGWIVKPDGGQMVGLRGLPAASVLGYRLAGRVHAADRHGAALVGVGLAIGSVLITDALVVVALVAEAMADSIEQVAGRGLVEMSANLATDFATTIAAALFFYVIGALLIGLPVLVLTIPAAMVRATVVRFLAGRGLAG